jgi:serine protease AprX
VTVTLDPKLPVHPMLQYGAVAEPGKKVQVIVQKKSKSGNGVQIAAENGGKHLESFGFIKSDTVEIEQGKVSKLARHKDVLWVGPNGAVQRHGLDTESLMTTYPLSVSADKVWNDSTNAATGKGVTVAVIDTGVVAMDDLKSGSTVAVNVNASASGTGDGNGHGTHVIGIVTGRDNKGNYIGIAPDARVVSVKIADDAGVASVADLLRGLQWCYDNRSQYNIRAVNLSIAAGTPESYLTSPVCAAVETLWLNGVVVVVAAGNKGTAPDAVWYAPANDPYVITVGAIDESGTGNLSDDVLPAWSSRGMTQDSVAKPDVLAPGRRIYSALAAPGCALATSYPDRIASDRTHIRLTGTSMAAPVVTGAIALLLERFPNLTPNQVKWLITQTMKGYGAAATKTSGGIVDSYQMISTAANGNIGTANGGLTPSLGIASGDGGATVNTAYWDNAYWDNAYWDNAYWDASNLD